MKLSKMLPTGKMVSKPRSESDVQTILPIKQKPQQVKDHEERKR